MYCFPLTQPIENSEEFCHSHKCGAEEETEVWRSIGCSARHGGSLFVLLAMICVTCCV